MAAEQRSAILLEAGTNEAEFMEFTVCGHHFGVNVHKVRQAVSWSSLRLVNVPNDTPGYLGEVALRGTTISVISLRDKLRLPVKATVDRPLLLVMEFNQRTTGFLIDEIATIHRVSWQQFSPFEQVSFFSTSSSVIGSITVDDRVIQILDLEAMMGTLDESMNLNEVDAVVEQSDEIDRAAIRLVYAEDSKTIQKLTSRMLGQAGFTNITSFPTGAEALRFLVSEAGAEADILLTDIEMPEMDGLTLCRRLRERSGRRLPVIFYSSMINDQMSLKCEAVGGDRCFAKPDIKGIIDAIDELYESTRAT